MNKDHKNTEGARRLLLRYMHHLNMLGIKSIRRGTRLQHVKWMCDHAESNIDDVARLNRWIGFIQAWLVSENIYSLEECMRQSRELLYTSDHGTANGELEWFKAEAARLEGIMLGRMPPGWEAALDGDHPEAWRQLALARGAEISRLRSRAPVEASDVERLDITKNHVDAWLKTSNWFRIEGDVWALEGLSLESRDGASNIAININSLAHFDNRTAWEIFDALAEMEDRDVLGMPIENVREELAEQGLNRDQLTDSGRSFVIDLLRDRERLSPTPQKMFSDRLVWVDLETTGIGDKDLILEIAVTVTDNDLNELSSTSGLVRSCNPNFLRRSSSEQIIPCWDQHFDSGLIDEMIRLNAEGTLPSEDCMSDRILSMLLDHGIVAGMDPDIRPPLCGSSVHFDRRFIRRYMPKLHDVLHYRNIDVSSIRELARRFTPDLEIPSPESDHRALSDLRNSIELLRFFRRSGFLGK